MNLRKVLHHYKAQNSDPNHFNDQVVQVNQILREDLREINKTYVKLVKDSEEAVKRRKLAQAKNEELSKQNQELQGKVQTMEKEFLRLQRRSQALDGLTMPTEAARSI